MRVSAAEGVSSWGWGGGGGGGSFIILLPIKHLCLVHFSLAGVSRSTTIVVAYLMTVTNYGWEECLSAVKAVRSFVGPNYGFQQQLQQFQMTQVSEVTILINVYLHQKYT